MSQIEPNGNELNGKPWGKLSSFNINFENVSLVKNEYSLGRQPSNDIKISDIRLSGVHCKISKDDENNFWIEDLSSNGTFLDDEVIGKGKKRKIVSGDKIYLLHPSKVQQDEIMGYVFSSVNRPEEISLKRQREDNQKAIEEGKKLYEKNLRFQEELGEEMMCCICIDYLYQCVTLIPCLHNFCAACFSDWMQKSKICPQCREEALEVKKNHVVNNIIEKFMENNPDKKRPQKEYDDMDAKNKIKEERVILRSEPEIIGLGNSSKNQITNITQPLPTLPTRRAQPLIGNVHVHSSNPGLGPFNPHLSGGFPYSNPFGGLNYLPHGNPLPMNNYTSFPPPPPMMNLNQNMFHQTYLGSNLNPLNNFVLNNMNMSMSLNNNLNNIQNQLNTRFFGGPSSGFNPNHFQNNSR